MNVTVMGRGSRRRSPVKHRVGHRRHVVSLVLLGLLGSLAPGCAAKISVSTPLIARVDTGALTSETKILLTGFHQPANQCFRDQITAYFSASRAFVLVSPPPGLNDRQLEDYMVTQKVNLVLSGQVDKYEAGSNAKTRNLATGYFAAFVVTAPVALGYAVGTEWKGHAIAAARMAMVDSYTDEKIWSLQDSVLINEQGKELASDATITEALLPVACKNLVTKMLNDFVQKYATYATRK